MYSYAYITMAMAFIVTWVVLFIFLSRSRPAIVWTSLMLTMAGPVATHWVVPSYWRPIYLVHISYKGWDFGLEDFLITFAVAGISAGIFESIALRKGFTELPRVTGIVLLRIFAFCVLGFLLMVLLVLVLGLTPIHALLLTVLIPSSLILYRTPKIIPLVLPVSVIFGLLFWLFYIIIMLPLFPGLIQALWNLDATFGIFLLGIPIEEMLWAFTTVLFAGPVYRFCCTTALREILGIKKQEMSNF
jgi:hypothetical protein